MLWLLAGSFANGQPAYREAISQGLAFQMQADSMQRLTEARTLALAAVPESQKSSIKIAIRDCNAQTVALQKKADECFLQASRFEGISAEATAEVRKAVEPAVVVLPEPKTESIVKNVPKQDSRGAPVEDFAILEKSSYSASNPIPVDRPLPGGVIYKIQLGAYGKPLAANAFKGLTPVSGERAAGGVTRYYAGLFRKFDSAVDALRQVHAYGYKDAFIVAFYNQKAIGTERARQLENLQDSEN